MYLLFIGDVVGKPGMRAISSTLPRLRKIHTIDIVVANAENIADGNGVTPLMANHLFSLGIDVLTNGNHAWDKEEALEYIKSEPRLLRPHNYPNSTPGSGWCVTTTADGRKLGILNILGSLFMPPELSCPFQSADNALTMIPPDVKHVFVDIHAESASEKIAMGWYLDGRVSAVVGTHTHVPTADERILPKGTGYLTDVGMTGCYESVVGMDTDKSLHRLMHKLPGDMEVADGEAILYAVLLELNDETGCCDKIQHLRMHEADASCHYLNH